MQPSPDKSRTSFMHRLADLLSEEFRLLYRQFLLRIVDLEALAVQADVVGYLGQFAGVFIMISLIHAFAAYIYISGGAHLSVAWHMEQYLIKTMMLVTGLFAILTWDATFPDKRDICVLSPLPVPSHTILFAKLAASGYVLGLAIATLNIFSGLAWSLVLGLPLGGWLGVLRCMAAYWCTMVAASLFLFCSVLSVQGLTAILLPRRTFLRVSAVLQLAAFALFLVVFFLQPVVSTRSGFASPRNYHLLDLSPTYWFFALFNRMIGTLPEALNWMAERALISLGLAMFGAIVSLALCYFRTMRRTIEEPDIVSVRRATKYGPQFGNSLAAAIAVFCVRCLLRSRQHRVVLAFYIGVGFAISLFCVRTTTISTGFSLAAHPIDSGFLMATAAMMSFAVVGLRSCFALPISLTANWALRTTQVQPSEHYIAATRRCLLLLSVVPVWIGSAVLSMQFRPFAPAALHLLVLALLGCILVDVNLRNFHKVPFTCSYLPGKSNVQLGFWAFIMLFVPLTIAGARYELRTLGHPARYLWIVGILIVIDAVLLTSNRLRAREAVLYYEENPEDVITTLNLVSLPVTNAGTE